MKDLVDQFKRTNNSLCPECGNYDGTDYEMFDQYDPDNIDDVEVAEAVGLTLCIICGRYFT